MKLMLSNIILVSVWLAGIAALAQCSSPAAPQERRAEEQAPPEVEASEPTPRREAAPDTIRFEMKDGVAVLSWDNLADITFEMKYHEMAQAEVPIPVFGDKIQAVAGKEVQISGYVIPLEETGEDTYIVLSAFPYTQCFFCGGAGPESVMDILPGEPLGRLDMDEKVTFRGRLRLNDSDLMYLNYILDDAVLVE